jgi:hypothetical protein
MKIVKRYTEKMKSLCLLIVNIKLLPVLLIFFLFFFPSFCVGQEEPQYDEITVNLRIPRIGTSDISALVKSEKAYLSISDVFTLLKIKNTVSITLDSISGFFINPQDEYLIDRVKNRVIFQGKKIELKQEDLMKTETNLYMKTALFGELFGLNCQFNILNLSVDLTTQLELPTIREMKTAQVRDNLKRLRGEIKIDTIIGRSYPLLKFGMADWAINTLQQSGRAPTTQLNLALGSVVAGGEMNMRLYADPAQKFDITRQIYFWRYANNEHKALRQVIVGKVTTQSISSVLGQVIGIQLTNTPTIYRKSFGTYTLSNTTEPGWMVELYINGVLIDYQNADASGFYKFEVPLTYGNSVLKTRMIGPLGEIREKIENTDIPFNFLPKGELEYTSTEGIIENRPNTKFSRTNINYGVNRRMSIGGGYEYFFSPGVENSLPFIGSSLSILKNLLLSGEYVLGTRLKSSLSYHLPSNFQLNMNYTGYVAGQKAILNPPIQQRGISIAVPLRIKRFSTYYTLSVNQSIYATQQTTNAYFLFSGSLKGISSNFTTNLTYQDPKNINTTSNLVFSFFLPKHITLRPSAQYDYNQRKLISTQWQLEKPLFKRGYLNVSYNKDFITKLNNSFTVGFRYDFSFMQTDLQSQFTKYISSYSQSANGSLIFDRKSHYLKASNTSMVGQSGLTFYAFLDLNGNGVKDNNEPKVFGLNLRVNGGNIERRDKDSTIRVINLIPYTSYLVELDNNRFQNIAWKVKKTALSVYADPNQFKTIAIPVEINSEAAGTVNYTNKNGIRGLGRIYVDFYRSDEKLFGRILTESDGYYSFMGLKPGNYIARIDSFQLANLRMKASPAFKTFTVKSSKDGDFIDGLDFTLQSTAKDTIEIPLPKVDSSKIKIINYASNGIKEGIFVVANNQGLRAESNIPGVRYSQAIPSSGQTDGKNIASKPGDLKALNLNGKSNATLIKATDQYAQISEADGQRCSIQYGEYTLEKNALSDQRTITKTTGRPVIIVKEGEVYKLWIEGFNSRRDARAFLASLGKVEMPTNVDREVIAMNRTNAVSNTDERHIPVADKDAKIGVIANPTGKNQLVDYTDSIANIFKFEPEGSKTRGFPTKGKQTDINNIDSKTGVKPLQVLSKSNPSNINAVNQSNENPVVGGGHFSIQIDGFIFDKSATAALRRISTETKLPIIISIKNGFYNLLIEGFNSRREAKSFEDKLAQMGFKGTIVRGN